MNELYAHALVLEGEAAKHFVELERYMRAAGLDHIADEFESIGKEEREQYELLAVGTAGRELPQPQAWEYAGHFLGPQAVTARPPRNVRDALTQAIATERRTQNFYVDVAEHATDDTMCAFAAEMAVDESRHIQRLERLLAREPDPQAAVVAQDDVLPLKT